MTLATAPVAGFTRAPAGAALLSLGLVLILARGGGDLI